MTDTRLPQSMLDRQSDQYLLALAKTAFLQVAPGMDTSEANFPHHLLAPFCLILAQLYVDLEDVERRTSLSTATGADLDVLGDLYGVLRTPAASALATVTFTGTAGATIAVGARVSTTGPQAVAFQTTAVGIIPGGGSVAVPVEATTAGASGNVGAGAISLLLAPAPSGVSGVTNALAATGGADPQADGATGQYLVGYRADIHDLSDARGEGGAAKHLRKWARSVGGVGRVRVVEATPTPGWATISLLGADLLPASPTVVQAVEDFLLDPWRLSFEVEGFARGGFGTSLSTQSDGLPAGGTANTVKLSYSASGQGTLTQLNLQAILPQPGIWRVPLRIKRGSSTSTGNLLQIGLWNQDTGTWAMTRPNGSVPCVRVLHASDLATTFAEYEFEAAWDGLEPIELRVFRLTSDTVTDVWVDQVGYISTFSREDHDVGLTPAGMRLLVETAATVDIDVAATLTYGLSQDQTIATVQADIHTALAAYLGTLAFQSTTVRRAAIESVVFDVRGVVDVASLLLNGGTANVGVAPTSVAILRNEVWS